MKTYLTIGFVAALVVAATAIAYPPLKIGEKTEHSLTIKKLDCNTRYKVRVSERDAGNWTQTQTVKRQTKPCPEPPPPTTCEEQSMKRALAAAVVAASLAGCQMPNPASVGTPANWAPQSTTSSNVTLSTPGQVYHDVWLTNGADITVTAPNVTIRNVRMTGGYVNNDPNSCANGLTLDHVSITDGPGDNERPGEAAVSYGGYTFENSEVINRSEGLRVSSVGDCGPVNVTNSYLKIVPPSPCGDWHGDGIQSWYGDAVTVRYVTIDMRTSGCYGTAPFFRPSGQGNQGCATINSLLVMGQGYSFRNGTCGSVNGLMVVNGSWIFGPVDVKCSALSGWDAHKVTIDSNYNVTADNGPIACSGSGT